MFFVLMTLNIPHIQNEVVCGWDFDFHLCRIAGLADALASGNIYPVGVYSSYFQGWGYAVGLFYPDIFLLPFSWLHAMGLDIILSYKLFFFTLSFFCCVTSYFAGRGIAKSHEVGLLLMVGYGLSQCHLCNLLSRPAIGAGLAMIFVPLFVWGIYNLTEEKISKPWIIIVATLGLLLSHTLSFLIVVLFGCFWCLLRAHKLCFYAKWIKPMLFSIILVSALGCFYWLPFLEQLMSNEFRYSQPWALMALERITLVSWLMPRFAPGLGVGGIMMMILIPLSFGILLYRRGMSLPMRMGASFFCCALVIFMLSMSFPFWHLMDEYSPVNIQFPWRLNILSHFFLYLSAAVILSQFKRHFYPILGTMIGLGMLSSICLLSDYDCIHYSKEALYEGNLERKYISQSGSGAEWLPMGASLTSIFNSNKALYTRPNGAQETGKYLESGGFSFTYEGLAGKYKVPLIWYKGYRAYFYDAHNVSTELDVTNAEDAAVLVSIPEGLPHGKVLVSYQSTPIQKWSFYVSCATALLVLLYLTFVFWRHVKKIKSLKYIKKKIKR